MKIVTLIYLTSVFIAPRVYAWEAFAFHCNLRKIVFLLPALCNFWRIVNLKLYFTLMMLMNLFVHVCVIFFMRRDFIALSMVMK